MAYLSMGEAHRRITDYVNRFSDADALNIFKDFNRLIKQSDNDSQFGKILVHLFRAFQSYRIGNFIDSYQAYEKPANAFIQEFRNWDTAWALPALYVIAYDIRVLAERADKELALNGKSPEKWKGAGSFLMKVFGVLALHLCRGVIRSIGTARIFDFVEFPKRDKVSIAFGRANAIFFSFLFCSLSF
ncbi:hypothetical protein ACFX10_019437 [Malus domestica]